MKIIAAIGNAISESFALLFQDPNWHKTDTYKRRNVSHQRFLDRTINAQF